MDGSIILLGALAGSTIFLGLPVGRIRRLSDGTRALLNAMACGILVFLLIDIVTHANEPIEEALLGASDGTSSWARFAGLAAVAAGSLGVGLVGLVGYERRLAARSRRPQGPGAAVATSPAVTARALPASEIALLIAVGIGLHNFAEGLAIGQSAAQGETSLALLLVIGFGLHNATEGFGIVAPMAGQGTRPSWATLGLLGLIAGGPTFLGTILGQTVVNDVLYIAFLGLAAGSILYVIVQLIGVAQSLRRPTELGWGLLLGLLAGFATDYVLVVAGA